MKMLAWPEPRGARGYYASFEIVPLGTGSAGLHRCAARYSDFTG